MDPDQYCTVLRIHITGSRSCFHCDADPDPDFLWDADPDPNFHSDADPDPAFTLMRIRIWLFTLKRIQLPKMMRIHADTDPQ
jgi:hypothetical protein